MPRITISYRRDDSGVITGRIFDRLVARYGREAVFRDIDDIPIGVDFREQISSALDASDVVLAVVGPRWIGPRGRGRLANEADPVRVEIEATLRKGVPLIPVLVLRGMMPRADQLPDSMKDFAYRNAIQVDDAQDFDVHMARLMRAMDRILEAGAPKPVQFVREPLGAVSLNRPAAPPDEATAGPETELQPTETAGSVAETVAETRQSTRRGVPVGVLILVAVLLAGGAGVGLDRFLAPPPGAASGPEAADSRGKTLQDELTATQQQGDQDKERLGADLSAAQKAGSGNQPDPLRALQSRAEKAERELAAAKDADANIERAAKQAADDKKILQDQLAAAKKQAEQDRGTQDADFAAAKKSAPSAQTSTSAPPTASAVVSAQGTGEESWSNEHRREVQRALALLGHYKGETDGGFGAGTRAAIKQFQTFEGDPETGTLTEPEHQALLQRAQRVAALLDQPATSPEGVSADTVKGGAPRYAKAWAAETGAGAKQDTAEAVFWYSLAAADGDARAFANLGTLLARGYDGLAPDPISAAFLWQAAAARGDVVSMYNLGVLYERGIGVTADPVRAKAWYQRAAAHNHPEARAALKRLGA
jgi:TPR repeat protein